MVRLQNNTKNNITRGQHRSPLLAPHIMENNIEQGQSPSTRAAQYRGQNESEAPAKPAAPTRPADAPQATSGATIAFFFARPHTTPAIPASQGPTAARDEPATAARAAPGTAASAAPATVSAVPAPPVTPQASVLALSPPGSFTQCDVDTTLYFLRDAITPLLSPPLVPALVPAMSAWSVKIRRAPFRHRRDARVYGQTSTAMHDNEYTPSWY